MNRKSIAETDLTESGSVENLQEVPEENHLRADD
jgi:hypothetical protein